MQLRCYKQRSVLVVHTAQGVCVCVCLHVVQTCTTRRWFSSLVFAGGDLNQLADIQDSLAQCIMDMQVGLQLVMIRLQLDGRQQYNQMREDNEKIRQEVATMGGPQVRCVPRWYLIAHQCPQLLSLPCALSGV